MSGFLSNTFHTAGRILGRGKKRLRNERTAKALLRIFAAFITEDDQIETKELEIAFDFVRNFFPNTDHGLLGKYLEEAVSHPIPLPSPLALLKGQLSEEQKTALALQLISLTWHGNEANSNLKLYRQVMRGLGAEKIGELTLREVLNPDGEASTELVRVDFGNIFQRGIALPNHSSQAFRCYQVGGMILIRNMSETPLTVRGYSLVRDRVLQLRVTDEVLAGGWRLTFDDLVFFCQGAQQDTSSLLYLTITNGELSMSRSRSRNAVARLAFGREVEIKALKEDVIGISENKPLASGESTRQSYHDKVFLSGSETMKLDDLRQASLQGGQRFRLPGGRRKVTVSNDPSRLTGDSLLLTPGLSTRFVLEIDFDPSTGVGELNVIESSQLVLVNGQPTRQGELPDGALIRISSRQALRCRFTENILDEERNLVRELKVEGLNYAFWKGNKTVDNLSLQVNRGQMLCIIGPSGSGKSTLLEILAGQRKPQSGTVMLNGLSLYDRRKRLVPLISFMPQEEALSSQLTAREHIANACAIRRPHLSSKVIQKRTTFLMSELGLERVGERPVGSAHSKTLSGGERSRLNAGLDLIGGGEIFLFDEPISGLSSKDAEHVVNSLSGMARDKIIITSLHRPSRKVLKAFDLVLLLDRGGKVAYFGSPEHLITYFISAQKDLSIPESGGTGADFVFDILETPQLAITGRIEGRSPRRFPPEFWQERFENRQVMAHLSLPGSSNLSGAFDFPTADDELPAPEPPHQGRRQRWMIFRTHLSRALKSKFRHRGTFYSILLEAPVLATLVALTLYASAAGKYNFFTALHLPSFLFLAVTVAMFFGLTNSATEVLRDRPILRRERNCQPHPVLYIGAKFLVLLVMIALQSTTFTLVSHWILKIHDMKLIHMGWMTLTGCCGSAIALLVSAAARSERTALGSIPLILVPQILLAGALIPFGEMNRGLFRDGDTARDNGAEPVPSTLMPLRYAYEGVLVSQGTGNSFEKSRRPIQETINALSPRKDLNAAEQQTLSEAKEKLSILYAATAQDKKEAHAILKDPLAAKERLMSIEHHDDRQPLANFFVNERTENLVALSEATRLDERRQGNAHVFLAEQKSFLWTKMSTKWYCLCALFTMIFLFLASAITYLRWTLTRT